MRTELSSDGSRRVVVLHGLGGIGKTQLAVEYAKRYRNEYSAVFWINIKDKVSVKRSFGRAAWRILQQHPDAHRLGGLDLQQDFEQVLGAVKAWLSLPKNTRWLLVYDNYDNPSLLETTENGTHSILGFLPEAYQGSVIVTTRLSQVTIGHQMRLLKLQLLGDGLKLLSKASGRPNLENESAAQAVAKELDGLPLALASAGAYLKRTLITFEDYIQLYRQSWASLHAIMPSLGSYRDKTLYSTWQISFVQVQGQNPLAAQLLRWWAYFDNHDIWFELLQPGSNGDGPDDLEKPSWKCDLTQDILKFNDAIGALHDYGFVELCDTSLPESGTRGYNTHSCVHSWAVHVLNETWDSHLAKLMVGCVAKLCKAPDKHRGSWQLQKRLLPHALHYQSVLAPRIVPDNEINWAFHNLGNLYKNQGMPKEAEEMYERALHGRKTTLGMEHVNTIHTANSLGSLYVEQDKLKEAEGIFLQALQGYKQLLGAEHPFALKMLHNLGVLYTDQGRWKEAEEMHTRALDGKMKALGPDHIETALSLNGLGVLFRHQGRLEDAEKMYEQALQVNKRTLGAEHTTTLKLLAILADILIQRSRLKKAEDTCMQALQGFRKALGENHILTLAATHNMGELYSKQGRLQEAEQMYVCSIRGKEKVIGSDHTSTLVTVGYLASLYRKQNKNREAEEMCTRALKGYEEICHKQGVIGEAAITVVRELGSLLVSQKRLADARNVHRRAQANLQDCLSSKKAYFEQLNDALSDLDESIQAESVRVDETAY